MRNAYVQYGLPQIHPDELHWGGDVKATEQLFPVLFIEAHNRLNTREFEVLWWYLEDPDITTESLGTCMEISAHAVRRCRSALYKEFRCATMLAVVLKANAEVEAARTVVRTDVRASMRTEPVGEAM